MTWEQPVLTAQLAAVGATALLEAIREVDPSILFYQASRNVAHARPGRAG
jgi:GDPmannose 4,6-dehydratase